MCSAQDKSTFAAKSHKFLYASSILDPVVTYGGEICTQTKKNKKHKEGLKKDRKTVYGSVKEDYKWRISNDPEIDELLKRENIS